ncbi:MAG: hypothetical protein WC791_02735 [Candidatus Paceibacterota bacterium]
MSKNKGKGDGKKKGKDKGGNKGDKKEAVAKVAKPKVEKPKGPKPDYTPRTKRWDNLVQSPEVVWNGWNGVAEAQGIRFRVSEETSGDGKHSFKIVSVASAPLGTKLAGIMSPKTYVTIASLHMPEFSSKFKKGSAQYETQERIWKFFHEHFIEMGLKKVHEKKATPAKAPAVEVKTSVSVGDLIMAIPGMYCFDSNGPRAVFSMVGAVHAPQFGKKEKIYPKIELLSAEEGHPLSGYVRKGAYIYHDVLTWKKMPNFKGTHAGDSQKIWEFLNGLVVGHRKALPSAILGVVANTEGMKPGDKVPVPADYRLPQAA